jgi:hypothetical protein
MRVLVGAVWIVLITSVTLAIVSQMFPAWALGLAFSEQGLFERLSPWFWVGLAVLIPLVHPKLTPGVAAGVILSLAAAAREIDLHKTATGYSVLKPGFYTHSEYPFHQQLIAGTLVLLVLASAVYLCFRVWKLRPWMSATRPAWLFALVFAVIMLLATKILDRAPDLLADILGRKFPIRIAVAMFAWEEGLEMLLAMAFAAVVISFATMVRSGYHRFEPECRTLR